MKLRGLVVLAVVALGVGAFIVNNAWAISSEDDCFFSWAEQSYPGFLAPAGASSQTWPPYYFRYYSQTNSYLGINTADQHLYYLEGDEMIDLGLYSTWKSQSNCAASGSEEDVRALLDMAFGLSETVVDDGGLTDQLEPLLGALMGAPSTCPSVATNLNLAGLTNLDDLNAFLTSLPNPITAQMSYGSSGCRTDTGSRMSGSAELIVRNFSINATTGRLSGQFWLTASQLQQEGVLLANGTVSGELDFGLMDMTGIASVVFENFQSANDSPLNGSALFSLISETEYALEIDIDDGAGVQADMSLSMTMFPDESDGVYMINSTEEGTFNQYSVNFNNIVFDSSICENYPVDGSAVFTSGGQSWTATFNSNCDGTYLLR